MVPAWCDPVTAGTAAMGLWGRFVDSISSRLAFFPPDPPSYTCSLGDDKQLKICTASSCAPAQNLPSAHADWASKPCHLASDGPYSPACIRHLLCRAQPMQTRVNLDVSVCVPKHWRNVLAPLTTDCSLYDAGSTSTTSQTFHPLQRFSHFKCPVRRRSAYLKPAHRCRYHSVPISLSAISLSADSTQRRACVSAGT